MISECGASLWCDPARWVPEAARLLRPGGRLVFHTTSLLAAICAPEGLGPAGRELQHPNRRWPPCGRRAGGVQFHPGHGDSIEALRTAGFTIETLLELYAPPDQQPPLLRLRHRFLGPAMARRRTMGSTPTRLNTHLSRQTRTLTSARLWRPIVCLQHRSA